MRKRLAFLSVGVLAACGVLAGHASAGPENKCYGEIASGIAATWPWAHEGHTAFPPPPGALALWLQEFGPSVGVSSVRELQLLFCAA